MKNKEWVRGIVKSILSETANSCKRRILPVLNPEKDSKYNIYNESFDKQTNAVRSEFMADLNEKIPRSLWAIKESKISPKVLFDKGFDNLKWFENPFSK